jgi:hypothetical protein
MRSLLKVVALLAILQGFALNASAKNHKKCQDAYDDCLKNPNITENTCVSNRKICNSGEDMNPANW